MREESRRWSDWLARWLPHYRQTRRKVTLSPETPEGIRLFWDAVGYGAAMKPFVASPVEAAGQRRVRSVLARWRRQHEPGAGVAEVLPARFRLVEELEGGFRITDESGDGDDAPVMDVSESASEPMLYSPSYLYFVSNALLRVALSTWEHARITLRPDEGPRPFPLLQPNLAQLEEELLAWSDDASPSAVANQVAYRSFRGLIHFVRSLDGRMLRNCERPPGQVISCTGLSSLSTLLSSLRHFELPDSRLGDHWVGDVGGLSMWLGRDRSRSSEDFEVGVGPEERERAIAWLAAQGARILQAPPPC
ncbi:MULTISPECIES: hypothetical protein [unclassified Myxococcus]|uniref:hypothetical protein n=2 Tax=Myxococcaceae TaxID=31 RepID=UPI0011428464|nr:MULTISPECIES: hypothetical protein [unclassified Myxococcus]MBZ4401618.1 hypothetical protein [Myxococcus sp. AS-1-15]